MTDQDSIEMYRMGFENPDKGFQLSVSNTEAESTDEPAAGEMWSFFPDVATALLWEDEEGSDFYDPLPVGVPTLRLIRTTGTIRAITMVDGQEGTLYATKAKDVFGWNSLV